jgi:PST family polysaccharide transporter
MAEGVAALAFLTSVVILVHDIADLWLFGVLCIGKHVVELVLQRTATDVFSAGGELVHVSGVWVSQIVTYAAANVDYLIVGAMLGAEALSVYAIGFRLASAFSSVVAAPLTRTAFVDFANTSDQQKQHDRLVRQILLFGAPGVAATALVSLLLPAVLGNGWEATRAVTILLGVALPWRLLLGPVVALGLTSGRALRVIRWELLRTATLAAAIVAASGSLNLVAGAVSAATILTVSWAYHRAVSGAGIQPSTKLQVSGIVAAGFAMVLVSVL